MIEFWLICFLFLLIFAGLTLFIFIQVKEDNRVKGPLEGFHEVDSATYTAARIVKVLLYEPTTGKSRYFIKDKNG